MYPPPSFFKATELVSALVRVLKHKEEAIIKAIEEKEAARRREERAQKLSEVNDRCEREMKKIEYAPADVLPARVLSESERRIIVEACDKELEGVDAKAAIDDFVVFCKLLSKTENRMLVQSAQYVEKAVQSRTVSDMTNEMAQELAGLPHYTAYVRLIEEKDGRQRIIKEKIETIPLPKISEDARKQTVERRKVVEENSRKYLKRRDLIEEEIAKRQERWLGGRPPDKPPPPRGEGGGSEARKGGPPPTRSRPPFA